MERQHQVDRGTASTAAAENFLRATRTDDTATSPAIETGGMLGYEMRPIRAVLAELQADTVAHFRGTGITVDGFLAEKRAAMMHKM